MVQVVPRLLAAAAATGEVEGRGEAVVTGEGGEGRGEGGRGREGRRGRREDHSPRRREAWEEGGGRGDYTYTRWEGGWGRGQPGI
jgi:hypothetical protein